MAMLELSHQVFDLDEHDTIYARPCFTAQLSLKVAGYEWEAWESVGALWSGERQWNRSGDPSAIEDMSSLEPYDKALLYDVEDPLERTLAAQALALAAEELLEELATTCNETCPTHTRRVGISL